MRDLIVVIFTISLFFVPAGVYARDSPIIIGHESADIDDVPDEWIIKAKEDLRVTYGHTSHGSQLITGINLLMENSGGSSSVGCNSYDYQGLYGYCDDHEYYRTGNNAYEIPSGVLSVWDDIPTGDLGNPDRISWAERTRTLLDDSKYSDRNVVIWSWCGQADTSEDNINTYLSLMNQLETDYPDVTFVYMTGHLNGGGDDNNLAHRNRQIRDYCGANNKVLFDFADIEIYDPDGNYYPDESDACNWCYDWCSTHACPECSSCAHSHCFNCYLKGQAFWHLMARIAGWEPGEEDPPPLCTDSDSDGYCEEDDDCNDANADINPGADEICSNGIDEDCLDGDLVCSACSEGQITERCLCGSAVHESGYCCEDVWSDTECETEPGEEKISFTRGWNIFYNKYDIDLGYDYIENSCDGIIFYSMSGRNIDKEEDTIIKGESYLVRVREECSVGISEQPLFENTDIDIFEGWSVQGFSVDINVEDIEDICTVANFFSLDNGHIYKEKEIVEAGKGYLVMLRNCD